MLCHVRLTDDRGVPLGSHDGWLRHYQIESITATRVLNDIGTLVMRVLPPFAPELLRRDNMVQLWHAPSGGALRLFRVYFIRRWLWELREGRLKLEIGGVDSNDLLRRRVIAAPTDIPRGEARGDTADNLMRARVHQETTEASSWVITVDYGSRTWSQFGVEADVGGALGIGVRELSYKPLLEFGGGGVLQELIKAADDNGDKLYFDVAPEVIAGGSIRFVFRVYQDCLGTDRTVTGGLVFGPQFGNLLDGELEYDYTREINNLYYGPVGPRGKGQMKQEYDASAIDASVWNRCEGYGGDISVAETMRELERSKGRRRFVGRLVSTAQTVFGRDWDFGDRVRINFGADSFNALVRAVTWEVTNDGNLTVHARIDSEDEDD